jgi:hypothetical protein
MTELIFGVLTLLFLLIVGIGLRRSHAQGQRDLDSRHAMTTGPEPKSGLDGDSSKLPMSRRKLLKLWVGGIAVAALVSFLKVLFSGNESRWTFTLKNWLWEHEAGWLVPVVDPVIKLDLGVLMPSPGIALCWTVFLALLWSVQRFPFGGRHPHAISSAFAVGWLAGTIFLVNWGVLLVGFVAPNLFPTISDVAMLFPIVIIWSAVVFLGFLFFYDLKSLDRYKPQQADHDPNTDERSAARGMHPRYLAPHRLIWASLVLVIVTTMLTNHSAYRGVTGRTDGLLAARTVSGATIDELYRSSNQLVEITQDKLELIDIFNQSEGFRGETTSRSDRETVIRLIDSDVPEFAGWISDTKSTAIAAKVQMQDAIELEANRASDRPENEIADLATSLTQTQHVLDQATVATFRLDSLLEQIRAELDLLRNDPQRSFSELESIFFLLSSDAEDTRARAQIAQHTFSSVDPAVMSIFLTTALLYSVFVLFPWFLLLLFLYRKRERRAAQIVEDLHLMDPSDRLIFRAIGEKLPEQTGSGQVDKKVEALFVRAFSSFEYVLSLTLLTIITAVGWYYFLYPRATLGLAELVRTSSGVREFTDYLTENAGPLTFGFAGAYFFSTQMLVRRYLSADLNPSAYLQAAERFLRVFILSLVLAVMAPLLNVDSKPLINAIAFFGGIWPRELQRFLMKFVNTKLTTFSFRGDTQMAPLTNLDGIDIWVETRLLEENIENVQGMATAAIETLIVGTYFPGSRIIDWVDQAILYIHCGNEREWFGPLRMVGIRTASDLLDALGVNITSPSVLNNRDFAPRQERLDQLACAIKDATGATDAKPSKLTVDVLRQIADSVWPEPNMQYVLRYLSAVASRVVDPNATTELPVQVAVPQSASDELVWNGDPVPSTT